MDTERKKILLKKILLKKILDTARSSARSELSPYQVAHSPEMLENLEKVEHKIEEYKSMVLSHAKMVVENHRLFTQHLEEVHRLQGTYAQEVERIRQMEDGKDGKDGISPRIEEIVAQVLPLIPTPQDGKDGVDATIDEDSIVDRLLAKIQKDKSLDLSHIKGAQKFIKDGVSYKIEELMHGGGGSSGGSGLAYLPLVSGFIDNSNIVFTFAKTPTIVVVNGASYINGSGVTISGTTATLDNPAGSGGSVYALG